MNVGCRQPVGTQARRPLFDFSGSSGSQAQVANNQNAAANQGGGFGSMFGFGKNNPYAASDRKTVQIQTNSPEQYEQYSQMAREIDSLNGRVSAFDSDNQQLQTEIAGLKQKLQVANDYNSQIRQQLADNAAQFQQIQFEKQSAEQQLANAQLQIQQINQNQQQLVGQLQNQVQGRFEYANTGGGTPSQLIGAATLRANNSLMQKLSNIQISGGQARMDGDVIRIEFPSDRLFTLGSYEVHSSQRATLQQLATTIGQYFPHQIIGIEAHWDGTPLNPPTTTHQQLTATQALSIFNALSQMGLPEKQMFTMGMGSNRPRHPQGVSGGISPNRRIEVVIYPETFDGSK